MDNSLQWLGAQPDSPAQEILEVHALAQEFRQEVQYRDDHEAYCQWYAAAAQQHRAELERMRYEVNFLNFFYGFRR
jgi:hypothetical protein